MTATTIPADLAEHRTRMMAKTGLRGDDYGIAPDESHKSGGGYHCGRMDCQNIGKYHPPATSHVGSTTEDYSVRQLRDRLPGGNAASAEDIGDDWPNGGRQAWLRFNNLLVKQLQAGDPELAAIREVNFSPDGTARKRWDALHPNDGPNEDGIVPSTDTVYMHTHLGLWRDTAGTPARARTLARIEQIAEAAIANRPLASTTEEDDMGASTGPININVEGNTSLTVPPTEAGAADPREAWLNVGNDTNDKPYALRIWFGDGVAGAWKPGDADGLFPMKSGVTLSLKLPKGTRIVTIMRKAVDAAGKVVDPTSELEAYAGHLTCCIERGPVIH
jgi:hypothetical protein